MKIYCIEDRVTSLRIVDALLASEPWKHPGREERIATYLTEVEAWDRAQKTAVKASVSRGPTVDESNLAIMRLGRVGGGR